MAPFLRVLRASRRHVAWMVASLLSMLVVSLATVFVYNLARPLYDQVLSPAELQQAVHETPEAHPPLIEALDGAVARGQSWLEELVGGGRRSLLLLVLIAVVVKNVFSFGSRYTVARYGLTTMRDLRVQLYDALLGQSPQYFGVQSTGIIVSRVVHDVEMIREALAERFGDLLQDALTVGVLVVYVLSLNVRLAFVTMLLAPVLLAPVLYLSRRLRRRSRQSQERMGELAEALDETVRGIRVVQAFGMRGVLADRFRRAADHHLVARLKARAIQAANAPVMEIVGALAALALIAYAAAEIVAARMTVGDFTAFLIGVYGTYNPLKRLNKFNLAVQQASVAAARVFEVIDAPVAITDAPRAVALEDGGVGVDFVNVCFSYDQGEPVLDSLDLSLAVGESVALVGPSGAGKSTVAHLIPRFYDVSGGAVRVGGNDVRELQLSSLRSKIGLVTQETLLFNDTVAANIAAGAVAAPREAVEAAGRAANAHAFVSALPEGYDTLIGEAGFRLSGGQRQRVAIARAFFKDPAILILDEATSALDAEAEQQIGQALARLMLHRTTLIIAHRLSTVRRADLVAVLDGGRVVARGSHDELLAAGGLYGRMIGEVINDH